MRRHVCSVMNNILWRTAKTCTMYLRLRWYRLLKMSYVHWENIYQGWFQNFFIVITLSKDLNVQNSIQGYRLTFFCQEQAGPQKQNDKEPSPKLRSPGFIGKLNTFQHHCKAFALLIIEVRDTQNLYSSNYLYIYHIRLRAKKGPAPPSLGNFADISYLEENFKPHLLRDVCTLCSGALVSDSLLHMLR